MPAGHQPSTPVELAMQRESLRQTRRKMHQQSKLDIAESTSFGLEDASKAKRCVSLRAEIMLTDLKQPGSPLHLLQSTFLRP